MKINYKGSEISLSSEYVGIAYPFQFHTQKLKHKITVSINGNQTTFDFYCNDSTLDDSGLCEAFYCFLNDCIAFADCRDIDDFQICFGYTKVSECIEAYNACKSSYEKWQALTSLDIYDVSNELAETYNL